MMIGKLLVLAALISSPSAEWKGYQRDDVGYDVDTGMFSSVDLPSYAEAAAFGETLNAVSNILDAASNACVRVHDRATGLVAEEAARPVILIAGDCAVENVLSRKNLTLVVPSWSYDESTRTVTAMVFSNYLLASAPIVKASVRSAIDGSVITCDCTWHNYGDRDKSVKVQVGDDPDNTFECYPLTFSLPADVDGKSVDMSQWGLIGDSATGFSVGNRQIRVNGEMTYTSVETNAVKSLLSMGAVVATDEDGNAIDLSRYEFFTDNGLSKGFEKEVSDEE